MGGGVSVGVCVSEVEVLKQGSHDNNREDESWNILQTACVVPSLEWVLHMQTPDEPGEAASLILAQ